MMEEVTIEEYNPNWSKEFNEEKIKLQEILDDRVLSIEHVGSTSVEGLGAKPIVDIAIGIADLEVVNGFIEPLKKLGYESVYHKEFPERRFFRKGKWRAGTHHLHFYKFEGEHWNNQILFRNFLRNNHDVLKEYHEFKVDLANKYRFDRVSYTEAKAPFIQKILLKAKREQI
ncbi:GrpB family protein [Peribacillus sp. NPDC097295]|uniref:GrpB family protein n=1 Tax=Peribacillus sp. NPDC097295 TaxID=3364402 RepID=UPI0037FC8F62